MKRKPDVSSRKTCTIDSVSTFLMALTLGTVSLLTPVSVSADIPPPQTFQPDASTGPTQPVDVSGNEDADDDTARPYGSFFYTQRYCSVRLTARLPPGLAAFLNVSGTNEDTASAQFGDQSFKPETTPIPLINNGDKQMTEAFVVPLRHNLTEFYLATTAKPDEPDYYTRLKGGVTISAVAVTCLAAKKTTTRRSISKAEFVTKNGLGVLHF